MNLVPRCYAVFAKHFLHFLDLISGTLEFFPPTRLEVLDLFGVCVLSGASSVTFLFLWCLAFGITICFWKRLPDLRSYL